MKQEIKKISEALGLMNSMIACGEDHSSTSKQAISDAYDALGKLHDMVEGNSAHDNLMSFAMAMFETKGVTLYDTDVAKIKSGLDIILKARVLPPTTFSHAENPLEHMPTLGARSGYYTRDPLGDYHYAIPQPTLLKPEYRNLKVG